VIRRLPPYSQRCDRGPRARPGIARVPCRAHAGLLRQRHAGGRHARLWNEKAFTVWSNVMKYAPTTSGDRTESGLQPNRLNVAATIAPRDKFHRRSPGGLRNRRPHAWSPGPASPSLGPDAFHAAAPSVEYARAGERLEIPMTVVEHVDAHAGMTATRPCASVVTVWLQN